jgi:hypothetical protein
MMNSKHSKILMVIGVLVALSLGLALAYSLLATQMPNLEKPEIGLNVVYTYISSPYNNSNLTGVWRNSSNGWQNNNVIFNYMIIMNITNYSSRLVQINSLQALVGPNITYFNDTSAVSATNLIVDDSRMKDFSATFNGVLGPYESKLVCLSGFTGVPVEFYDQAISGNTWVLGKVDAQAAYSNGPYSNAYDLKQVPLKDIDGNYLYNILLNDDQMLRLFGLEAEVVPRNTD